MPVQAEAGHKLALRTADRVNRAYTHYACEQNEPWSCVDWSTSPCRRLSWKRAACGGAFTQLYSYPHGQATWLYCQGDNYLKKVSFHAAMVYDGVYNVDNWDCTSVDEPAGRMSAAPTLSVGK